jgi:hypothetical protein
MQALWEHKVRACIQSLFPSQLGAQVVIDNKKEAQGFVFWFRTSKVIIPRVDIRLSGKASARRSKDISKAPVSDKEIIS